jgi:hypothetical protein
MLEGFRTRLQQCGDLVLYESAVPSVHDFAVFSDTSRCSLTSLLLPCAAAVFSLHAQTYAISASSHAHESIVAHVNV